MKKFLSIFLTLAMMLSIALFATGCTGEQGVQGDKGDTGSSTTKPSADSRVKYNQALELIEQKNYASACEILKSLGNYGDEQEQLEYFRYIPVKYVIGEGDTQSGDSDFKLNMDIFYNENHLPIKQSWVVRDFSSTYDYTYNSNQHLIETIERFNSNISQTISYIYDVNGNLIKMVLIAPVISR